MYSLNLLPVHRKKDIVFVAQLHQWRSAMLLAFFGAVIALGATITMDILLAKSVTTSTTNLKNWQDLSSKRESGKVTSLTGQVNQTAAGLGALFVPLSLHRAAMYSVLTEVPNGVTVSNAVFLVDGQFTLSGVASSRSSFLALRKVLEDSPAIVTVNTTSPANLRENLPFEYSGQLTITP